MQNNARRSGRIKGGRFMTGAAIINSLVFSVITAFVISGIAQLTVTNLARFQDERDYSRALDLAEAGVNYEIYKISQNINFADQFTLSQNSAVPNGNEYSLYPGKFYLYVANEDGSTPWNGTGKVKIYSTGVVNNVRRTIQITAKPYGGMFGHDYALYGVVEGTIHGTPGFVAGDVGTNGLLRFTGQPTVSGYVDFNGPTAQWVMQPIRTYNERDFPDALNWPSVSSIANSKVSGGLTTLANTNDNALASPKITNRTINLTGNGQLTLKGKAGGANYYVTYIKCAGNSKIYFDNANGPINLWVGPKGANTTVKILGGTTAVKASTNPNNLCRIYIATYNDIDIGGNTQLDAGVYNIEDSNSGFIKIAGYPSIAGSVIANKFTMNGNSTVSHVGEFFLSDPRATHFGFDSEWKEVGIAY